MLQDYHRQTTIKPFAPKLKDRSSKRWDSEISLQQISHFIDFKFLKKDSSSSRESPSPPIDESEEHQSKHMDLDSYIFNKHLNGISSMISNLIETDIDKSLNNLFDESKSSSYRYENDDYDPRSIRPPPFSQYIKQLKESRTKIQSIQRRSARIPLRTTKAEQLKLTRQQSANQNNSNLPYLRSSTTTSQHKLSLNSPPRSSINRISRLRANSNDSFKQSESSRSCKEALDSNAPLLLSAMLVKQMRQDIKTNRVPAYSKPLNSALLREQPNPPLTHQYKMKRIYHWLDKLIPTDYIEYNEYASNESTIGTKLNDKLDDEYDLLSDEKSLNNIERTSEQAHRVLPLFKSEIDRKMRQHNLLLTRLELDLYVI